MRRRGFLQMLGGALAAPLAPSVSFGAATRASYPASALHAAIYHAQSDVQFSVFTLAKRLGLDFGQTEELMGDLSARGVLGPLQGNTQVGRWARSNIWKKPFVEAASVQKAARAETAKTKDAQPKPQRANTTPRQSPRDTETAPRWAEPDIRPMLTHLHGLCRSQGRNLHPRCAAMVA